MRRRAAAIAVVVAALAGASGAGLGGADGEAARPAGLRALEPAARAAGCTLRTHRNEGRGHTERQVRYRTNPPTSGDHDPEAALDGVYARDDPPDVEQSVHALEHGRILVQYRPGTSARRVSQLGRLVREAVKGSSGGYHTLLFANQTRMPYAVAATAWRRSLTCRRANDRVVAAVRAFRRVYVDRGPEFIP